MHNRRRAAAIIGPLMIVAAALSACAPPPDTTLHHVTTWQGDVTHADTEPDIVSWVGYGSFAYNTGMTGCEILDGGAGWTQTFTRLDASTVRVTITLDWLEGDNNGAGYGCGANDYLNVGLRDATNTEVEFAVLPLSSHT